MVLSEISGTLIFPTIKRNSISIIKIKIEDNLNALKERTSVIDNVITFKAIGVQSASVKGDAANSNLLFRIYKEGKIVIEKEDNVIKIMWSVKLDTLYVLAIYISIVAGVTASLFADTKLLFSVTIGISIFLMFISLGILLIKYKMTDLIEACVYGNT